MVRHHTIGSTRLTSCLVSKLRISCYPLILQMGLEPTTFYSKDRWSDIEPLKQVSLNNIDRPKTTTTLITITNHGRRDLAWYNSNILWCLFSWNVFLGILSKVLPGKRVAHQSTKNVAWIMRSGVSILLYITLLILTRLLANMSPLAGTLLQILNLQYNFGK